MGKLNYILLGVIIVFFGLAAIVNVVEKKQIVGNDYKNKINIKEIEEYVEENPEDMDTKKNLAFIYVVNNQAEDAIVLLEEVLKEDKNDTSALHQLVISYMDTEQYEQAKIASNNLLSFNNYNGVALLNLAQIHYLLGDLDEFDLTMGLVFDAAEKSELQENEVIYYDNVKLIFDNYKKNLDLENYYEAYVEFATSIFFSDQFKLKNYELAVQSKNWLIGKELLEEKGKLEMSLKKLDSAAVTYKNLTTNYKDYEYGYILYADTLFKLNRENELNEVQKETKKLEYANAFISSILKYNEGDQEGGINTLEKLAEDNTLYETVFYYNLARMSTDFDVIERFQKLFSESEGDEYYYIAIMSNPELAL